MTRRAGFRIAWLENVRFALGAMRAQKLRSFLTLLGVMAGVATVIMMVSFVVGFNNQVTAAFTSFGAQLVQFQKFEPRFNGPERPEEERNRRDLTYEDALALKRLSKLVKAVSAERYLFMNSTVKAGRNEANGPVIFGGIPDYCEANVHFVQDGRFITDADVLHAARVAVIGTDVADALWPQRDAINEELTLNGRAYQVIGIFEHKGGFMGGSNDNFVAIPITAFDDQFPQIKNGHGDTIHIATVPNRPEDYNALIEEETAIMRARRGLKASQENDFATFTSVIRMRAPLAPIGCPSAMAPPFTFTFDSSTPSIRIELSATEANASLISNSSMSSTDSPAFSSAFVAAFAGVRARYGKSSATAAWATIVASAGRLLALAHSSEASTSAPAPSFTPGALPAVWAPSLWNAPRSFESVSSELSRLGASSISTVVSPFFELIVTGTISSGRRPSSVAWTASSCERSANLSMSARVISSSSPTSSASSPMCLPVNGLVSPSRTIASSALASPIRYPKRAPFSR